MISWHPYTGQYEKQFYDVRFPNGVIYYGIWPNAGQFRIPAEKRLYKRPLTLTDRDIFDIRISRVDDMGMPIEGEPSNGA